MASQKTVGTEKNGKVRMETHSYRCVGFHTKDESAEYNIKKQDFLWNPNTHKKNSCKSSLIWNIVTGITYNFP